MTFQKNPKQKSSYPGMLESFEKQRFKGIIPPKQKFKSNFNVRSSFVPAARKVPN
ncbi:MAG: hypothetical protein NTZ93_05020 [Candidatus Beckwithbacteria bacterium]|nr:hypothetical protein [Candidatus Beckwithbacteria bacterium]